MGDDGSYKCHFSRTMCKQKSSRKSGISSQNFGTHSHKNSNFPKIYFLLRVSQEISQVSRFLAKSSDSQKNFVVDTPSPPIIINMSRAWDEEKTQGPNENQTCDILNTKFGELLESKGHFLSSYMTCILHLYMQFISYLVAIYISALCSDSDGCWPGGDLSHPYLQTVFNDFTWWLQFPDESILMLR